MTAETWKIAQAVRTATEQDGPADAGHGAAATAAEGAAHGGGSGIDPMHQFEIKRIMHLDLFGLDISFTNSAAVHADRRRADQLVPDLRHARPLAGAGPPAIDGRARPIEFVANMVRENTGREGMQYFPFIFSLFIFILTLNMLGMVPYSFTVTSHIIVTFALALMVFLFVLIVGFVKNGPGFLKLFVPSGVPGALLPLITVLEVFSFLIRPISLSVRLFANMMAGHMMLKVFAAFVVGLGVIGGWAPLPVHGGFHGSGIAGRVPAGLRLHRPDLHLSQRCAAYASLSHRTDRNTNSWSGIRSKHQRNPHFNPRRVLMDPAAAKLIGAGIASTALIGAGLGIGNIFGSYLVGRAAQSVGGSRPVPEPAPRLRTRRSDRTVRPDRGADHPVRILSPVPPVTGQARGRRGLMRASRFPCAAAFKEAGMPQLNIQISRRSCSGWR